MGLTGAASEARRLNRLMKTAEVNSETLKALIPVIENVAWMKAKLDDAREQIADSGLCSVNDKGALISNPLYHEYESLWKTYMLGMNQLTQYLSKKTADQAVKAVKPKTVLELVRSKHTA